MSRHFHDWLPRQRAPRQRALCVEALETRCLLDGGSAQLKDINTVGQGADVHNLTPVGDALFFSAEDPVHGLSLWKTNSVTPGAQRVADFAPGYNEPKLNWTVDLGGTFLAMTEWGPPQLWRSDGTAEGTFAIREFADFSFTPRGESLVAILGNRAFFQANDGVHGEELWVTDGTTAGTSLVADLMSGDQGSRPNSLLAVGNAVYFLADTPGEGFQLWRTDGAAAGTLQVSNTTNADQSYPGLLTPASDGLYFLQADKWWFVGAHPTAAPVLVADLGVDGVTSVSASLAVNDRLYFTATTEAAGLELWKLDRNSGGPQLVADIATGARGSDPRELTRWGNSVAFTADDGVHGRGLWVSDGTTQGTRLIADVSIGAASSSPNYLAAYGELLLFRADDGQHGIEPWVSDGTADRTRMLADLFPGDNGSSPPWRTDAFWPSESYSFAVAGGRAYFVASDPANGPELRWTDGSQVHLVQDIMPGTAAGSGWEYAEYRGSAYFQANDGFHGYELWRSDGTEAGTAMVKDLIPGAAGGTPSGFVIFQDRLYFSTEDGNEAVIVWQSDGTSAGTVPLKRFERAYPDLSTLSATSAALFFGLLSPEGKLELWALTAGSQFELVVSLAAEIRVVTNFDFQFRGMVAYESQLVFLTEQRNHSTELWITDGTSQSTRLLRRFDADGGPGLYDAAILGGRLYFSGYDPEHGWELWSTDGTPEGTEMVEDLRQGVGDSRPTELRTLGKSLLYFADDGTGARQWFARGPASAVAERLTDFDRRVNTYLSRVTVVQDQAFAVVRYGRDGIQLWRTGGTSQQTALLLELPELPRGSYWEDLIAFGDVVLLALNVTDAGGQWWRSDGTPAGTQLYEALPNTYIGFPQLIGNTIYFSAGESWTLRPATGDANFDRRVDLDDFGALKAAFGQRGGRLPADFNQDGRVDLGDFGLFKAAFAAAGAPPGADSQQTQGAAALDAAIREIAEGAEAWREEDWALAISRVGPWTPLSHADPRRWPTSLPASVTPSSRLR